MSPQGSSWAISSPRGATFVFPFCTQRGLLRGADLHSEQGLSRCVSSDPVVRRVPQGPPGSRWMLSGFAVGTGLERQLGLALQ